MGLLQSSQRCQEGNRLAVGDGQKHMIGFARNVDAFALVHVDEGFLAGLGVHFHLHAGTIHEQDVFVKFRVAMVAAYLAGLDELMRPFQDRRIRHKGKNRAATVPDRVQVAVRLEGFHFHNAAGNS